MIYIIARTTRNATARSRTALQESELDRTASSTEIATNEPQTNVPIGSERSRNVWLVFDLEQALTNRVELVLLKHNNAGLRKEKIVMNRVVRNFVSKFLAISSQVPGIACDLFHAVPTHDVLVLQDPDHKVKSRLLIQQRDANFIDSPSQTVVPALVDLSSPGRGEPVWAATPLGLGPDDLHRRAP